MRSLTFVFIATISFVINIQASPLPLGDMALGEYSKPLTKVQHTLESALISTPGGDAPLTGLSVAQDNIENLGIHVGDGNVPKIGETVGMDDEPAAAGDETAAAAKTGGQATTGTTSESVANSDDSRT